MKKFSFIFIFIFLSGMLFTVIRCMPIFEEETAADQVELCKKAEQDDHSDDDDSDDDDPENEKVDLFFHRNHLSLGGVLSQHYFFITNKIYHFEVDNIHTPPPKI